MISRSGILTAAIGACLLLTALVAAPPSSATPAKAKFRTGVYLATLAKVGGGFKFKVVGHSATCGKTASSHCFIALTNATITEPCGNGQPARGVFGIPNGFVSSRGRFSYFQKLSGPVQPLISFTANLSGSSATGTLREKELYDPGTGTLIPCDSGTIHWTAKRR